jgi:hypothetical protein
VNNDTAALIVAVCGIVGVLVLLVALVVLRVLRFSVFGFANLILKMLTEPKEEGGRAFTPQALDDHSARDLRAKAAAFDFDAAVQKYSQAHTPPEPPGADDPPPAAPHSR